MPRISIVDVNHGIPTDRELCRVLTVDGLPALEAQFRPLDQDRVLTWTADDSLKQIVKHIVDFMSQLSSETQLEVSGPDWASYSPDNGLVRRSTTLGSNDFEKIYNQIQDLHTKSEANIVHVADLEYLVEIEIAAVDRVSRIAFASAPNTSLDELSDFVVQTHSAQEIASVDSKILKDAIKRLVAAVEGATD